MNWQDSNPLEFEIRQQLKHQFSFNEQGIFTPADLDLMDFSAISALPDGLVVRGSLNLLPDSALLGIRDALNNITINGKTRILRTQKSLALINELDEWGTSQKCDPNYIQDFKNQINILNDQFTINEQSVF